MLLVSEIRLNPDVAESVGSAPGFAASFGSVPLLYSELCSRWGSHGLYFSRKLSQCLLCDYTTLVALQSLANHGFHKGGRMPVYSQTHHETQSQSFGLMMSGGGTLGRQLALDEITSVGLDY